MEKGLLGGRLPSSGGACPRKEGEGEHCDGVCRQSNPRGCDHFKKKSQTGPEKHAELNSLLPEWFGLWGVVLGCGQLRKRRGRGDQVRLIGGQKKKKDKSH